MKGFILKAFIIITIIVTGLVNNVRGQIFSTTKSGNWSDATVWDLGTIPTSNDSVEILHKTTLTGNWAIGTSGVIRVGVLGSLNFEQLENNNKLINNGIIAGKKIDNLAGSVFRNAGLVQLNEMFNRDNARVVNVNTIKILGLLDNAGTVINQDVLIVDKRIINTDSLEILTNAKVSVQDFRNESTGILTLCGTIGMGLLVDNIANGTAVTANISFHNLGKVIGCDGGIYAGADGTEVTDDGAVVGTAFLCTGPNTIYNNNATALGEFTLNCCFLLEAEAGPNRLTCIGENVVIGGFPAAVRGTEPYSYLWATDNSYSFPGVASENPVVAPTNTTKFILTVQDGAGCIAKDSVIITPTTEVIARAGGLIGICEGESAQLGGEPSALCGAPGYTISWTPAADLDDPSAANPWASPTETTMYILTVEDAGGIVTKDTTVVFVDPRPVPAAAGNDQIICDLTTSVTGNTPTFGIGQWIVVSGTARLSNEFSPTTDVYDLVRGDTVVLKWAILSGECYSEDEVTITILNLPSIANAGPDQELCNATSTILNGNVPEFGVGRWNIASGTGLISTADLTNPQTVLTNLVPGTTVVLEWEITQAGCPTTTIDRVQIINHELPSDAFAGDDQSLCYDVVTATLQGRIPTVGVGRWVQTSGNATLTDPLNANTTVTGLVSGATYAFSWQISNGNCAISADEVIVAIQPVPALNIRNAEICAGETVSLQASGGRVYSWSPVAGLSDPTIANPTATPDISTIYVVTISNPGCADAILAIDITVNPTPIVEISNDTTILAGDEIQLFARGGSIYRWSPADGLDNSDLANPLAGPRITTTYTVQIENEFGCITEESVVITVDDQYEIFVPQLFTPNGDSNNDLLFVNSIGLETLNFKIFDRHGKLLFETTNPDLGWDGRFNGTIQNIDTYVYLLTGKTYGFNDVLEKGTFQLVK